MVTDFKTAAELDALCLEELSREGKITKLSAGSRARMLLQSINQRIGEAYDTLKFASAMRFLSSSSGIFLDLMGTLTGTVRRTETLAVVDRDDEVIKFYVNSGTLKAKIPGGYIPAGTVIQNEAGSIQYQVTEPAEFDDVASEVYVSAAAASTGAASNVGNNVLNIHSLGLSDVYVTNEKSITSGADIESDDNYRYRISNSRAVTESANLTAVRLAMLPVPGVSDVVITEYAGMMDALVLPAGNYVSESVVRACEFLGNREKAGGVRLRARGPEIVPFEVYMQIQLTRETPAEDSPDIKNTARLSVLDYFANIQRGGYFVPSQLSAAVQSSDERIFDHKLVCLSFRRRPYLHRRFQLRWDELFAPDTESENPVTIAALA